MYKRIEWQISELQMVLNQSRVLWCKNILYKETGNSVFLFITHLIVRQLFKYLSNVNQLSPSALVSFNSVLFYVVEFFDAAIYIRRKTGNSWFLSNIYLILPNVIEYLLNVSKRLPYLISLNFWLFYIVELLYIYILSIELD